MRTDCVPVVPMPVRPIGAAGTRELEETETVAAFDPLVVGVNVTLKLQLPWGWMVPQLFRTANNVLFRPASVMPVTWRGRFPVLVMVKTFGAGVDPLST